MSCYGDSIGVFVSTDECVTFRPHEGDNMTFEDTAYLSGCEDYIVLCEQCLTGSGVVRTDFVSLGRYAQRKYGRKVVLAKRCYK